MIFNTIIQLRIDELTISGPVESNVTIDRHFFTTVSKAKKFAQANWLSNAKDGYGHEIQRPRYSRKLLNWKREGKMLTSGSPWWRSYYITTEKVL